MYTLHQSDYRIPESRIFLEYLDKGNWLFMCIDIQSSNQLIQMFILGLLKYAWTLSKGHPMFFQNDEFLLHISRINKIMK